MKIAFLGDMAFFGRFSLINNPELYSYFEDVKNTLSNCDYVVGNLEAPFVSNGSKSGSKSAYISSHESNVNILTFLGVNAVNLSNNHMFDFGCDGFKSTVKILNDHGIKWFGCDNEILTEEIKGEKFAFHGYCSLNTNPLGVRNSKSISSIDHLHAQTVANNVKSYEKKGYFNIVSVHSGIEHVNIPSFDDVKFARYLSSIAPYLYYGHHPHVLQGVEEVNDSLIAYSLGNFCFDDIYDGRTKEPLVKQSENNKTSMILIVEFDFGKIVNFETVGIYMGDDRYEVNVQNNLNIFSEYLTLDKAAFDYERNKQIGDIVRKRNASRDLSWLLSRFRVSTIFRLYDLYKNKFAYKKVFGSFVEKI